MRVKTKNSTFVFDTVNKTVTRIPDEGNTNELRQDGVPVPLSVIPRPVVGEPMHLGLKHTDRVQDFDVITLRRTSPVLEICHYNNTEGDAA